MSFLRPITAMAAIKMMMTVASSRMMPPPTVQTTATMVARDAMFPVGTGVVDWDVMLVTVGVPIAAARLAQHCFSVNHL